MCFGSTLFRTLQLVFVRALDFFFNPDLWEESRLKLREALDLFLIEFTPPVISCVSP